MVPSPVNPHYNFGAGVTRQCQPFRAELVMGFHERQREVIPRILQCIRDFYIQMNIVKGFF